VALAVAEEGIKANLNERYTTAEAV